MPAGVLAGAPRVVDFLCGRDGIAEAYAGERKGCVVRSTTYDPADAISEGLLAFETAASPPHRMATAVDAYRKIGGAFPQPHAAR